VKELTLEYSEIAGHTAVLSNALMEFLYDVDQPDDSDLMIKYTESPAYLRNVIAQFHTQPTVMDFIAWISSMLRPDMSVIDVGCSSGFTIDVSVYPYDEKRRRHTHSWAVALDVIEHTGNHLGFLSWMKTLGDTVAFTVPHVSYRPPYVEVLDEWVDIEALLWVIERRYDLVRHYVAEGRTFVVYR
jgi:hypothetical protein